jgi:hypothetical protein
MNMTPTLSPSLMKLSSVYAMEELTADRHDSRFNE